MPRVLIAGGGLAGLAAAAALGGAGFEVDLFEARAFLGGRATSYTLPSAEGSEVIDNCQHVLLACFTNLLNLYERLGVGDRIRFFREFRFVEPGGRVSLLRSGSLPAPLHFLGSFAGLHFLGARDKLAVARGLRAIEREHGRREDLDRITMLDWLREKRQTPRAISRFWQQVLVSAINEDLDRMAAGHGFQVFWQGFLARPDAYHMGLAAVPLSELYAARGMAHTSLHMKAAVDCFAVEGGRVVGAVVDGERHAADYYVSALPFERVPAAAPALGLDVSAFEHSPITGIHLWFDRPVMEVPHATLLDRTMQWAFNKSEGRYIQLVVSASRSLLPMSREAIIELALGELREFFPAAREARLVKAHVVKEVRATFSARPGLDALRPAARTAIPNLFLAGDWTRTGWPATMEGAVRSGYLAAEAVAEAAGRTERFLLCDN
ncbi:MAG TPA: hydroxysqualene dehydroxylase HpnE [Bryobacteraceae bacterium]|nr:hydroxysqualene dehydroxylase HpnE [Bryobacteraceae bacterium]